MEGTGGWKLISLGRCIGRVDVVVVAQASVVSAVQRVRGFPNQIHEK